MDDGSLADGLNLGSVVVDEETGAVILIYSLCFHRYHCKPSNTMMVQSLDDGFSWSTPRNLNPQLGLMSFIPGPGFGIQVFHLDAEFLYNVHLTYNSQHSHVSGYNKWPIVRQNMVMKIECIICSLKFHG